jgi:Na+/proline symporter
MGSDLDNQILPQMALIVLGKLHPAVLVLFFSALISAIMSSADSSLLAGSSLFCNNILKPFFPEIPDKKFLFITRISTVLLLALSLFFAMSVQNIYLLMKNSWVTQLVVVFIPVVTAIYLPKASPRAAWVSMLISLAVWLGYCGYFFCSATGSFTEIMSNFDRPVTCGAVYGFAAGVLAFGCCYLGERVSDKFKGRKDEK